MELITYRSHIGSGPIFLYVSGICASNESMLSTMKHVYSNIEL